MKTLAIQETFQRIHQNKSFELFVISIIIFSALVVGLKTYSISPLMLQIISVLDWSISIFFLIEITIRFISEENKKDFFKNGWNIFDTLIVTISLIPIEDSEMAVVGRLIRIFRVLRMISIIPELRILLTSLMKAMPQLGYIVLMLFIIFYIYAAIGSIFFEAINPVLWSNISISMLTLFRIMTFEGWTDIMYETMVVYPLSWIYYLSFIFLTTFAFLNMVIGIVVNVLDEEHREAILKEEEEKHPLTLEDLDRKIELLMAMVEAKKHKE
jgi:voltage-gated sodium channel